MFIYRLLYKDLISAANQNCIIDIPSKKKKSKRESIDSQEIRREQNERRKGEKNLQKQVQNY